MRRNVEFRVEDGILLRGYLHSSGEQPLPAIVMAHGFSGVKEQIDHYASLFAGHGFLVLVHDHRGFGASEGQPRFEVDAQRQLRDWRDAITFVLSLPEADAAAGVGIWGSSFAGGLAMILAAIDSRVRCLVSQVPNVSGHRNGREMFNAAQRARLRTQFDADRNARLAGAEPQRVPVFSPDPGEICALPPPMSQRHIEAAEATAPSWRNEVTLRSVENMLEVEPAGWVQYIAPVPFMMIVGAKDTCTFTEHQLAVFAQAREPKRLVIHPGGHFDTYSGQFERTSQAALEWFQQHMGAAPTDRAEHGLVPDS